MDDHDAIRYPSNLNQRSQARRAKKLWWWPRWLQVTTAVLGGVLIGIGVTLFAGPVQGQPATTTVIPQPGPTWTSYVPQMPLKCQDMLDAADALYDTSTTNEQLLLRISTLAVDGTQEKSPAKLLQAGKAIEQAQKLSPKLKAARNKFLDIYQECAKA